MELLSESYGVKDKSENVNDVINNEIIKSQDRNENETDENENENENENNIEKEFPQNIPAMPVFSGLPKMPVFMPPMPVFTDPRSAVPITSDSDFVPENENENENEIEKKNTTIDVEKKIIIENEKKQKKVRFFYYLAFHFTFFLIYSNYLFFNFQKR